MDSPISEKKGRWFGRPLDIGDISRRYYLPLCRFIYDRPGPPRNYFDVGEIAADTIIKAWKRLDTYDASKASLFTWLCMMAKSAAVDWYRKKANRYDALDSRKLHLSARWGGSLEPFSVDADVSRQTKVKKTPTLDNYNSGQVGDEFYGTPVGPGGLGLDPESGKGRGLEIDPEGIVKSEAFSPAAPIVHPAFRRINSPLTLCIRKIEADRLHYHLDKLTENQKRIITLRLIDGWNLKETVAIAEMNISRVKQFQLRAKKRLIARLKREPYFRARALLAGTVHKRLDTLEITLTTERIRTRGIEETLETAGGIVEAFERFINTVLV